PSPFCTLVTAILSPRKKMSFSRLPRLSSAVRTLHTSCPARQPAANPTEIFQKAFGERAAAQTSPLMKNEVQDNREQFKANQFTAPQAFTQESIYPTARPLPRPPLLGPPKKIAVKLDPFYITKTNPLVHDMNPNFAYEFVNPMGKIRSRAETGLTWKSQRRVGKLVRRARAMGIISRWTNRPVPGGLGWSY
ncbi:ribosomal protein S18, partial [Cryptococcus neoformans Tu401-1]